MMHASFDQSCRVKVRQRVLNHLERCKNTYLPEMYCNLKVVSLTTPCNTF